MANQLAKTTQTLTTAAEMRDTTSMLMQTNANWEEYLTPAPVSIAILGELVFISSCEDFSINNNAPKDGFKYIQYPDSFRACLMQVCNSGWHAFNEAHKNMDQIRIHTGTVPDYMKEAVKILFNAPDEVLENFLPNQLQSISDIANDCVKLADGVEKKYIDVINLIQELVQACISSQKFYGDELEIVKRKLKEAELKEESAKLLNKRSKKAMEAMAKHMEEAQEEFKQSMDSLPTGWDMIGMDCAEAFITALTGLINGVTNQMTQSSQNAAGSPTEQKNPDENVDGITQMTACSKSGQILKLVGTLKGFFSENEIDWKNLYDQKNNCPNTQWAKGQFERISEEMKKMPKDKTCDKVLSLCAKSLNICEELAKYTPDQKLDEATTKQLIEKLTKLNEEAFAFDSTSKGILGTPALTPKPPMMYKAENSSSEKKSAGQRAAETARFKIEQSRKQLKQTREQYEKCVENMEKNEKELNDVLIEMQNCHIKQIDFKTTIKMLVKGLDAMGRVKTQWEKMVRFFQMVSNIIKTSLSKTLHNFVTKSEHTKKLSYNGKLFTKDLVYNQAFQASNIASLVHMISTTYTEVSNKYLMDRVSSLGRLMAMDKEKPEFLIARESLQQSCKDAKEGIFQLVLKNKNAFERKTDGRIAKIEGELKAVLPAAPPKETERIKEIVQGGFNEEEIDMYS